MMILSLVLLSVAAVLAEPEAPQRRYAVAAPSAPTLAYVTAPLVVGSHQAAPALPAPAAALLAYTAPGVPAQQQQYIARTYNGITTLALEPAAPPAPFASQKYVVTNVPSGRVVVAEAEPARYYDPSANVVFAAPPAPAPAPAPGARVYTFSQEPAPAARVVAVAPQPAPAPIPAQAAVVAFAAAPEATSSSSQYFSRNYNGVPQVTYFVVGPAPAPVVSVAPRPQQGAAPPRRPNGNQGPAGEPVNPSDVEVLDA